jgi:hypothetical protein
VPSSSQRARQPGRSSWSDRRGKALCSDPASNILLFQLVLLVYWGGRGLCPPAPSPSSQRINCCVCLLYAKMHSSLVHTDLLINT